MGGWQAEWPTVSALIQAIGVAAANMAEVTESLAVDPEKMRANIEATRDVIFAERAMILLGKELGRDKAHYLLEEATRQSVAQGRRLTEVLAVMPEVTKHLDQKTIQGLNDPQQYLGAAEAFCQSQVTKSGKEKKE